MKQTISTLGRVAQVVESGFLNKIGKEQAQVLFQAQEIKNIKFTYSTGQYSDQYYQPVDKVFQGFKQDRDKSQTNRIQNQDLKQIFQDSQSIFQHHTKAQLLRSIGILSMCKIQPIVKNADSLMDLSKKALGQSVFNNLVKNTIFDQFVGGQTEEEIEPLVERLQQFGIKTIFDFAVEADLEGSETVDYSKIVEGFISSIQTSSKLPEKRFTQLKMTGLGDTQQLYNFSKFLRQLEDHLEKVHLEPKVDSNIGSTNQERRVKADLNPIQTLKSLQINELVELLAQNADVQQFYHKDFDFQEIETIYQRLRQITQEAKNRNVKILVDAEQQYFQPALDFLAIKLQMEFNKDEGIIFNTHQCYLIETPLKIEDEIQISKAFNYTLGTKLVRGAYMVHERKLAQEEGKPSPIQPNIANTHESYNRMTEKLIKLGNTQKREVMIASHNQDTIELALEKMRKLKIDPSESSIYFAQLYGMADYLTYPLASLGCQVYKAIPYGKIDLMLPYLVRRAQENSTILGGSSKEINLMRQELVRRAFAG